jgi:SAM-dependent methyltransferase
MTYEDYTKTSQNFDRTRRPIGVEILLGCFATLGRPLSELVVLDAGCGTGSYSLELLPHIGRIEGVEVNVAMFERARRKAAAHRISPDRFLLHEARIEQLPFTEGHFDAVMVNQVLHHLDDDAANGFPRHRAALNELARVMRPGGVLVINICSTAQLDDGWWYRELFADAYQRCKQRHIPLPILGTLLAECGLSHRGNIVPTDAVLQGNSYWDGTGPLRKEWRDGDSVFALATEQELEQACSQIRQLEQDGTLADYVAKQDVRRQEIGQVTFVHAVRLPSDRDNI